MSYIKEDFKINRNNPKSLFLILFFRTSSYFALNKNYLIRLIGLPIRILYRIIVEWLLCVELPDKTKVGRGLRIYHGQGLVVNSKTIIGDYVTLRQNTTIGNKSTNGNCPVISDFVDIGANCVIIGDINIQEKSIIGAGSVVINDVLPLTVVAGNPARMIKKINKDRK